MTWFGGLALTREDDGTTTLRAAVRDQAELHGLLTKVRDLGVTLISLTSIDAARDPDSQEQQHQWTARVQATGLTHAPITYSGATATIPPRPGVNPMATITAAAPAIHPDLSLTRLHLMRAGYLLMGVGLALVKWPLLPDVATLPLYEGVTLCILTAMSLLAFLGLRYPVKLLPVLLFESLWKLFWLALVALPQAITGDLDAATTETVVSCSLVVVILAVTPWRYVWRNYVRATGTRWR